MTGISVGSWAWDDQARRGEWLTERSRAALGGPNVVAMPSAGPIEPHRFQKPGYLLPTGRVLARPLSSKRSSANVDSSFALVTPRWLRSLAFVGVGLERPTIESRRRL
jgi:hypothetical protein